MEPSKFTIKESMAMSKFSNETSPEELKKIMEDYLIQHRFDDNILTIKHINAALRQALWVGFCRGKGWE